MDVGLRFLEPDKREHSDDSVNMWDSMCLSFSRAVENLPQSGSGRYFKVHSSITSKALPGALLLHNRDYNITISPRQQLLCDLDILTIILQARLLSNFHRYR